MLGFFSFAAGVVSPTAFAAFSLSVTPNFPIASTVGDSGVPASLTLQNKSTSPQNSGSVDVTTIELVPSCGEVAAIPSCPAASIDLGVFQLSPTGVGRSGTACAGVSFTIAQTDPVHGTFSFSPPSSVVTLGAPASATDTCTIDFSLSVFKAPTKDADPGTPGLQTAQLASAAIMPNGSSAISGFGSSVVTVSKATPTMTVVPDTATLSGGANPTGTITFQAFGPDNPTCTGTPVFTSVKNVSGDGAYTSDLFTPPGPGNYRFVVNYSGDANNMSTHTVCGVFGVSVAPPLIGLPRLPKSGAGANTGRLSQGGPRGGIPIALLVVALLVLIGGARTPGYSRSQASWFRGGNCPRKQGNSTGRPERRRTTKS